MESTAVKSETCIDLWDSYIASFKLRALWEAKNYVLQNYIIPLRESTKSKEKIYEAECLMKCNYVPKFLHSSTQQLCSLSCAREFLSNSFDLEGSAT